jgi:hypothetical protein
MADEISRIPYREGEPPPGPDYTLAHVADTTGNDEGWAWVSAGGVNQGAVQRERLEPLLPMLRWMWRHISGHVPWCRSFADWELAFSRNSEPAPEVDAWVRQTYIYLEYVHKHPNTDKAAVFAAVGALMKGLEGQVQPASVLRTLKQIASNVPETLTSAESFSKDGRLKVKEKHLR